MVGKRIIPPTGSGKQKAIAAAWEAHAVPLAMWTMAHLVNRNDVYGCYLSSGQRTAVTTPVTRTGKLTRALIARHGAAADVGDLIGLHSASADNRSRWVAVGIGHHGPKE